MEAGVEAGVVPPTAAAALTAATSSSKGGCSSEAKAISGGSGKASWSDSGKGGWGKGSKSKGSWGGGTPNSKGTATKGFGAKMAFQQMQSKASEEDDWCKWCAKGECWTHQDESKGRGKGKDEGNDKDDGTFATEQGPQASLCVKGLPGGITEELVRTVFASYGDVVSVKVLITPPGAASSQAIVRMKTGEDAQWVCENVNGNIPSALDEAVEISFAAQGSLGPKAGERRGPY